MQIKGKNCYKMGQSWNFGLLIRMNFFLGSIFWPFQKSSSSSSSCRRKSSRFAKLMPPMSSFCSGAASFVLTLSLFSWVFISSFEFPAYFFPLSILLMSISITSSSELISNSIRFFTSGTFCFCTLVKLLGTDKSFSYSSILSSSSINCPTFDNN